MRQIRLSEFKHQANRQKIKDWVPCQITVDGDVVAIVLPPDSDIIKPVVSLSRPSVPATASPVSLSTHALLERAAHGGRPT